MQAEAGRTCKGKVTGITKFGAFISLPDNAASAKHAFADSLQFLQDWEGPGRTQNAKETGECHTSLPTNRCLLTLRVTEMFLCSVNSQ